MKYILLNLTTLIEHENEVKVKWNVLGWYTKQDGWMCGNFSRNVLQYNSTPNLILFYCNLSKFDNICYWKMPSTKICTKDWEHISNNDSAVRCSKDCHYHYHQHCKLYGQFNIKDYMQSLTIHTILCWKKKIYYMIYRAHAIGTIQEKKSPWEGWLRFLVDIKWKARHLVFLISSSMSP